MMIGGQSVDAADGQTFEIVNPATGAVVATAPMGGKTDVDRAVEAARKAFDHPKGWSSWAAGKRGRTLAKFAALIKDKSEERGRTGGPGPRGADGAGPASRPAPNAWS